MSVSPALFAAILAARSSRQQLAISVDTLVENVHFSMNSPVDALGYKCVAVNLSDMAAMGATALALQCTWSDPRNDPSWREALQQAIRETAAGVPMSAELVMVAAAQRQISIQIIGEIPRDGALTRAGVRSGDQLWVSGTLGDAGAGLALSQGRLHTANGADRNYLLERLQRPTPRLALGEALRGIASAAIDVSDGIAGDASHLAARSKTQLRVFAHRLPLSAALLRVAGKSRALRFALAAGEDYELAFSAPAHRAARVRQLAGLCQVPVHCIGEAVCGGGVVFLDERMRDLPVPPAFDHFAADGDRGNGDGERDEGPAQ